MKHSIKIAGLAALLGAAAALSGCVYDPAYYRHTGVVYSDGNAAVDYDDSYSYSSPGYYYPAYYGPAYYGSYWGPYYGGWGWPYVSLGFYGGWYGHHHSYHGPYHPHSSSGHASGGHSAPSHHH